VEIILQQGRRAADIVERLTNFANRQKLDRQSWDLNTLVTETIGLMRQRLSLEGIALREELAADLPVVEVHPGQVQQIILSLLQNAREAILRVERKGLIQVRTRRRDGWVRLEVEDDGPGIPAEYQGRIFDPFFTTKEPGQGPGLGLGLSLIHRMVQEQGGQIWVEPRDPGTCVIMELPG
jgi:signal transduction histidine kinase